MPRSSHNEIAKTPSPHAAEQCWLARTYPRQRRTGLETVCRGIEERFPWLASTWLLTALRRTERDASRYLPTPRLISRDAPRRVGSGFARAGRFHEAQKARSLA